VAGRAADAGAEAVTHWLKRAWWLEAPAGRWWWLWVVPVAVMVADVAVGLLLFLWLRASGA
jgi:hypothetical protein